MSTDITGVQGFDATKYAELLQAAATEYVAPGKVDEMLLEAIAKGKSFDEAVTSVKTQLPALPPPVGKGVLWQNDLAGLPSMGANVLALISDLSSEQRRQAQELRNLQTEAIVAELKEQAQTIRDKAVTQLVMGIVTGTLSIAQGVTSGAMMAKGVSANNKLTGTERQSADMLLNTKVASFNSAVGGVNSALGGVNNYLAGTYDAELKETDAQIERMRAFNDALNNLEQSMKEVMQKSISTMDAIQQNMNQARTRIMTV